MDRFAAMATRAQAKRRTGARSLEVELAILSTFIQPACQAIRDLGVSDSHQD
jgi:hypothetical protein